MMVLVRQLQPTEQGLLMEPLLLHRHGGLGPVRRHSGRRIRSRAGRHPRIRPARFPKPFGQRPADADRKNRYQPLRRYEKLLLALFLVFTLPLSAEEQPAVPTADEQAAALINAQEWFRLEACYPEIRDELSPFVRLLCEASLGSHFNRLPESLQCHRNAAQRLPTGTLRRSRRLDARLAPLHAYRQPAGAWAPTNRRPTCSPSSLPDRARKRGLRPWRPNGGSKPWPDIRARRSRNPTAKSGCR